ncbi:response regulator [Desulfuromonas acetoxidans]|uniref:PAS/PAC sensor protein n=1 Tax=Desulfuromonas acetoxidans (strain DSM 684 / 11070) TaxID=281689 RepID=Q1JZ70_DESA6|nr:response regulator [Desulfuromonas acetoxidans]EAT15424.1 putative PAS/PAC sensor protein [Desulfuromonas acetoxidans DSM 684]MBF0646523.1 response regulator [Desulfuromonas acetoxidans]NVD26064.1 response regulator [Desulfuromonas acetoxidans]NVE18048.1 response regulator [Desulfuromonas acetoxidans]
MAELFKILFVDDEANVLKSLRRLFLDEEDYDILTASSGMEGLEIIKENNDILVIISDYRMPEMTGVEFLAQATQLLPHSIRIVLSGYADTAAVVEAINIGHIYKFIPKPWDDDQLRIDIHNAVETVLLDKKNRQLSDALEKRNKELKELNSGLEKEVEKRTASLRLRSQVLQLAQEILDSLPIAVLGIDLEDQIVQINQQGIDLLADEGEILLGASVKSTFPPGLMELVEQIKRDGNAHMELDCKNTKVTGIGSFLDNNKERGMIISLTPR